MKTIAIVETTIIPNVEYSMFICIKPINGTIHHKHGFFFYNAHTMHNEEETNIFLKELEKPLKNVVNLTIEDVKKSIGILNEFYTKDLKYKPLFRYPTRKRR